MKILINMILESKSTSFGAGVLPIAKSTGRILLAKRGKSITYPNQWTNFGGGSDDGETPIITAKREFKEESGYKGRVLKYFKLKINNNSNNKFEFHNFVALIPDEFIPVINKKTVDGNIEVQDYVWVTLHELSTNRFPYGTLHYGIKDMIRQDKPHLKSIIKNYTNGKTPKY